MRPKKSAYRILDGKLDGRPMRRRQGKYDKKIYRNGRGFMWLRTVRISRRFL
jgi:hypothetical protein